MGFLLTVMYAALNQLSLVDWVPGLGRFHVFLWLAGIAALTSLPVIVRNGFPLRAQQVYLMTGLVFAVGISRGARGWFGGIVPGMIDFLTSSIVFYLVLINVNSLRRIRFMTGVTILVCLYLLSRAVPAYYRNPVPHEDNNPWVIYETGKFNPETGRMNILPRIRGKGLAQDPNDFAQLLLVAIPFLALAWRPGRLHSNLFLVILPAAFMLFGIHLTHSRGALVGLLVLFAVVFQRRMGLMASAILPVAAFTLFLGSSRAITMGDASAGGRLMSWGAGISMFKSHPIFGVGYNSFLEHNDLTAHNSFVLCFAELGFFGYFFWMALIVFTIADLNSTIPAANADVLIAGLVQSAKAIRLSLFAFLATAWFLSRTYTITLYLLLGLAVAIVQLIRKSAKLVEAPTGPRSVVTVLLQMTSIMAVYLMNRLHSL